MRAPAAHVRDTAPDGAATGLRRHGRGSCSSAVAADWSNGRKGGEKGLDTDDSTGKVVCRILAGAVTHLHCGLSRGGSRMRRCSPDRAPQPYKSRSSPVSCVFALTLMVCVPSVSSVRAAGRGWVPGPSAGAAVGGAAGTHVVGTAGAGGDREPCPQEAYGLGSSSSAAVDRSLKTRRGLEGSLRGSGSSNGTNFPPHAASKGEARRNPGVKRPANSADEPVSSGAAVSSPRKAKQQKKLRNASPPGALPNEDTRSPGPKDTDPKPHDRGPKAGGAEGDHRAGETNTKPKLTGRAFASLMPALRDETLAVVRELGYTEMAPVQEAVIPLLLSNKDVVVEAPTGKF